MSKLGSEIIAGLKNFIDQITPTEHGEGPSRFKFFKSYEEAAAWKKANPGYHGPIGWAWPKKQRRVDQTPPKPYNAVVEPTED